MTFGLEDFQDLIRLLGEHPEWRAELRRHVLTEELLQLPDLVRQLADAQVRTEQRLERLTSRVDELVDAQLRTEQRLEQLTVRVDELAAAQVRTEQRLEQLTARVDDLTQRMALVEDQISRLTARIDALTERMERVEDQISRLTARVDDLTVQLQQLTARVDELTQRMERVENQIARLTARVDDLTVRLEQLTARVGDLTARMERVEDQIAQLTARMEQLTARVDDLAAAQVRTEQRLEQLIARVDAMERDLSNLRSEFRGYRLEWRYLQRPSGYFGPLLRRLRLVWPSEAVDRFDDQLPRWAAEELLRADLLVTGEPRYQPDIGEVWLVVEISARIDRNDVERALRRTEALRRAGLPVLPAVAGERTTQGAKNAVREHQVVLFQDGFVEGWEEALRSWAG